jgi:DNA helicase-2/ATP-dependent DNA helicase PcrA
MLQWLHMNTDFLKDLNERQREAATYTEGPLLIVAGAGAGKTKTLTYRIINLIRSGVSPDEILAVTFTNKAAKEMRDRTIALLSDRKYDRLPFISTFHALGVYILKENAHTLGLTKHFAIADEDDAIAIIKDALKSLDLDPKQYEPRKIKSMISRAKGDFISRESFSENAVAPFAVMVAKVWELYEKGLKNEGALDFDDLLLQTVMLLKKYPEIKLHYQNKWKYIHIDEYQDTNEVQYELTKLLVGPEENICVVGDTDQNIYSWRGANIKNMLHFEKDYPRALIVMLEQNYRSTKTIIEAANEIIKKNVFRAPKNLFTENILGEQIGICVAYDETVEANFIAQRIEELCRVGKAEPKDIAILYRANFQSRVLEEALLQRQIPYHVLGVKFFDRKEVKDILSYIRASLNRESLSDIKRIINIPARGIGKVTLAKLFANQVSELPAGMQIKIQKFYALLENFAQYLEAHSASESIKYILEKSGMEAELKAGGELELERLENVKELVTLALKYDSYGKESVDMLLTDAALASDQDSMLHEKGEGVRLMTVHASKGLEFKYVFIAGLEQDLFPHAGIGGKNKSDGEEERRLFYVAVTRAEHKLFLSYANIRTIFGMRQVNSPSEFLSDIPAHLTVLEEANYESNDKVVYL